MIKPYTEIMRTTSCTTLSKSKYKSKLIIVRQKNTQNILEIMCVWDRDSHAYTKKYIRKYLGYKPANINKSWEQNTQKYPESPQPRRYDRRNSK